MENVCTVLLARLGSSRLPKKHLKEFCGITVIEFLFKRANLLINWPNFILATTTNSEDDELEEMANKYKVTVFRGSENDVVDRIIKASEIFNAKWINRLNGDNIFFDYELINDAILKTSMDNNIELISNVTDSKTPGFTVEIIQKDALVKNHHLMDKDQREHVTQFFYQNYDNSKFYWLDNRKNLINLAIDTQDDLNRAKKLTQEPYNFDYRTPVSYMSKFQFND